MDSHSFGTLLVTMFISVLVGAGVSFMMQILEGFLFFASIFSMFFTRGRSSGPDVLLPDTSKKPWRLVFGLALWGVAFWLMASGGYSESYTYGCAVIGGMCVGSGLLRCMD